MAEPMVVCASIAEQQQREGYATFPGVLVPSSNITLEGACSWISSNTKSLASLLSQHGSLLFRGFPVTDAEEFNRFIHSFEGFDFSENLYVGGGGPRIKITGPVHTSTESPPSFFIPLHHELAYLSHYPSKLFFFCEVEPAKDGETPICLSSLLVDRLETERPEFVRNLRTKKLRYKREISDRAACTNQYQKSWQDIFFTDDRAEAEERARRSGHETVEWSEDGAMRVTSRAMEAFRWDEREVGEGGPKGRWTWFNSLVLLHPASYGHDAKGMGKWVTTYGDGEPVADEDVLYVKKMMMEEKTQFQWRRGDVLLVDNFLTLHSRNSFTPPRRVLAAMVN